jgi:hypothetical protein
LGTIGVGELNKRFDTIVNVLKALAIGTLLGDAFLHLIPSVSIEKILLNVFILLI